MTGPVGEPGAVGHPLNAAAGRLRAGRTGGRDPGDCSTEQERRQGTPWIRVPTEDNTTSSSCTGTAPCDHVLMELERAEMIAVYERYLSCCNDRRFDQLGEFVSNQVSGSGPVDGLAAYIDGVEAVCTAFPDYRWQLQNLVVEGDSIAARLIGQGTHTGPFSGIAATGRRISIQELVTYRFRNGKIVECWGDLYPVVRDALTAPGRSTT